MTQEVNRSDAQAAEGQTPLDELRAEFAKKLEPARILKRFPARGKRIVGEFRPSKKVEARAAVENLDDEYLLAEALVRILIHDPAHTLADDEGLVPLGAWAGKPELDPLRFDHRLSDVLGIIKGTPAQIALALFDGNDLQLAEFAGEIAEWSLNTEKKAYADFRKG